MDDILQQFGKAGTLILKILFVLVAIRILIFALGLKIVEYIPVIDDIITVAFWIMTNMSQWAHDLVSQVVKM